LFLRASLTIAPSQPVNPWVNWGSNLSFPLLQYGLLERAARLSRIKCSIAINRGSGLYHAKKSKVSELCYVNSILLD